MGIAEAERLKLSEVLKEGQAATDLSVSEVKVFKLSAIESIESMQASWQAFGICLSGYILYYAAHR